MRAKMIFGAALSALLLSSTAADAERQPANQITAAAVTPPSTATSPEGAQGVVNGSASTNGIVWYTDPIVLVLGIFAIFAAIDIAILVAKNSHHGNRHALR